MDPLPLIPKSNIKGNNDSCHVIREAFQDVLDGKIYPKNISENITKYNVDHNALKLTAASVELAHENVKIHLDEITDVETEMMMKQGKYIINESLVKNDCEIQRFLQLKRYPVFEDINEERAKKFGLIQKLDLLPSRPERALDFRINSNRHLCTPPCPKLDLIPTKLEKDDRRKKKKFDEKSMPPVFQAYPDRVIFENYVVGETYEKKFSIKNISKNTRCLQPRLPSKSSCFRIELVSRGFRLAPGMDAVFRVVFLPKDYLDVQEIVSFCTYTENDVTVKLISYREAPNLHAYVFRTFKKFCQKLELSKNRYFDEERATALNWTVDFGSVLLGDEVDLSLILKNEGGPGRFFLISEDEWNLFYLNSISKRLELTTGCFQIFPVYFKIEQEQFVEISAKFFPLSYGLQAEKCVLLCDNTSYEEIDLIGDGVIYEPYFIRIEAPTKVGNTSYVDSESEYYLYLGNCLSFSRQLIVLTVHNDSCLDLDYRWEIKKSVCFLETTKLKRMEPSWVQIKHESHQFPANSTTDFEIIVSMNTYEEGQYSIILRLCIENIPEVSLAEGVDFLVFEKEKDELSKSTKPTYVDVIAGDVEISCVIESVHLIIEPPQMIFPIVLNYKDRITKKIQLLTNGKFDLHCKWKLICKDNENRCIHIKPTKFVLHPEKTVICELTLIPYDYEDIREKLILEINNGVYKKEYNVMAKVEKPMLRFSCSALNFGHIPLGTSSQKTFEVKSLSREHIDWRIVEFTYDFEEMEIVEIENEKQLSTNCGSFDYFGESATVTYAVEGKENHRWFSFLMLLSSHPTQIAMDSICLVTYEVCQPDIFICSSTCDNPILCPRELLFLGVATSYEICLHNRGNINGYFIWGKTVGSDANFVEVTAEPRTGILKPDACCKIVISLVPLDTGIFEHIYLPCFVGRMDEPIMLTILCAVDNVHVNFFLPQKDGSYLKVLWPEKIIADVSDYELAAVEYNGEGVIFDQAQDMSYERRLLELQRRYQEQMGCEESRTPLPDSIGSIITIYENKICESDKRDTASLPSESWTSTTTLPEKIVSTESLTRCFKSDLVIQKNVIELLRIPIHTLTKSTFIIQNVTPINANFNVEPFNFGTEGFKHKNIVDDALVKLKLKQRNEWEELITTDSGIVIKSEPLSGTLPAFESVEVDLLIYANTWGVYVEEIWIEINDIAPFCFTLMVQIVGNPIEFPFALNTIKEEPILRFGYIQYEAEPVTRKLKVKNTSAIPLHLHWEGFLCDSTFINNSFSSESNTYDSSVDNIDKKCMMPDYGSENTEKIFKIKPKQIMILPKTTAIIHVTFFPKYFSPQFLKQQIEALIVGHIHIREEYQYQPNYLSRMDGTQAPPPQVKVLAAVELPLLKMDIIGGTTNLKVSANEVIIKNSKTFEMRLVFKNNNKSDAIISMHTTEPFKVISLRTLQTKEQIRAGGASVKPDECLEAYIECTLLSKDVIKMYDMLYKYEEVSQDENIDLDNYSITVSRFLNIHQKGVIQQFVPLQITVYYPIIEASEEVDFGVIFAGSTKKLTLPIYNQSCAQVHFKIMPPTTKEFIVSPLEGVIEETTSVNRKFFNINIYFTPNCNKRYKDHLSIVTNISNYSMDITLKGSGSNNEKFCTDIL